MISRIALTGMMGSGKSTVGRLLSNSLSLPLLDLDEEIERSEGRSISEIFDSVGESRFRSIERRCLEEVCGEFTGILATGGGVVLSPANRETLHGWGRVIYLRASVKVLAGRLAGDQSARPLLGDEAGLEEGLGRLMAAREELYQSASLMLDTDLLTPAAVCREIVDCLSA